MKKCVLALALAFGSPAFAADPVEGMWQTQVDDGAYAHIRIAPCGEKICGVIARSFNSGGEYKSDNLGKPLVWDMVAQGGGRYGSGNIWQPSTGKVYRSKMVLDGDVLKVSGCIGPICKAQSWARVK